MTDHNTALLNVLITIDVDDALLAQLQDRLPALSITVHPAEAAAEIPPDVWAEVEVLVTGRVLPDVEMAPRLRWVQATSAGVDAICGHPLFQSGEVLLTTASGIHAVTMAEYALAFMLALARRIPLMLQRQAAHEWPKDRFDVYIPVPLRGSTLGIVGYGSIGRELGRVATALGMRVLATKRDVLHSSDANAYLVPGTGDASATMVERLYPPQALKSMLRECDFVVLLVPRTPETLNLISKEAIEAMKPGAILVNLARGGVVDEEALLKALKSGALAGAGFDVFAQEPLPASSPLWQAPNMIISPHIGGNMSDYMARALDLFAVNVERYLERQALLNVVNRELGY